MSNEGAPGCRPCAWTAGDGGVDEPDADVSVVTSEELEDDDAPATFTAVVEGGETVETFSKVTVVPGDRNIETVVNAESEKVRVATLEAVDPEFDQTMTMPKPGTFPLEKVNPNPVEVKPRSFAGSENARPALTVS